MKNYILVLFLISIFVSPVNATSTVVDENGVKVPDNHCWAMCESIGDNSPNFHWNVWQDKCDEGYKCPMEHLKKCDYFNLDIVEKCEKINVDVEAPFPDFENPDEFPQIFPDEAISPYKDMDYFVAPQ